VKKSFILYCTDKDHGKGEWEFRRYKGGMDVTDADGQHVCWFSHEQANDRFALPSFWRSIKNINFTTDKGALITFEPDPRDVRIVRQYLDDALLAGGVEAVTRLRNKGLASLAGGLLLAAVCVVLLVVLDPGFEAGDRQRRRYGKPLLVGVIFGIALVGGGAYALIRSGRLMRRWKEEMAEEETGEDRS
jgi:hypothetical protein